MARLHGLPDRHSGYRAAPTPGYAARMTDDIETKAIAMWVADADAAAKGGEQVLEGSWDAVPDDLKDRYRTLAGGIEKARKTSPP
jgi:hypothetical protein